MRAFVVEGFGPSSHGRLAELPQPECLANDLLVRMAGACVNPADWKEIEGKLASFYPTYPARWVPGHDGAGIVEAIGDNVEGFAPGDRVVLMAARQIGPHSGTLAEYVRVDQAFAAKAPLSISLTVSASIPTAGVTAHQALFRPDVGVATAGQSILIHGASGGIGSFAVTLASAAGLRAAATCRAANAEYVRELGAEVAIDYTAGDVIAATRRWAPRGVDIAIDSFSGGKQSELLDTLAPGGRLVVIATVTEDGDIASLTADAQTRGLSVHFLVLNPNTMAEDLAAFAKLVDHNEMKMPAITTYPLDEAAAALAAIQAGKVRGKLVIPIADID
jgi:NADPH2:quinone reductase